MIISSEKLKPLKDYVLFKEINLTLESKGGILLPENTKREHVFEAAAVGPDVKEVRAGDLIWPNILAVRVNEYKITPLLTVSDAAGDPTMGLIRECDIAARMPSNGVAE